MNALYFAGGAGLTDARRRKIECASDRSSKGMRCQSRQAVRRNKREKRNLARLGLEVG